MYSEEMLMDLLLKRGKSQDFSIIAKINQSAQQKYRNSLLMMKINK